MPEPKSRFFGYRKSYRNENEVTVFRASVPIPCYRCGANIMPSELFTRSASKDGKVSGIRYTFCQKCEPFEERVTFEPRKRSKRTEGDYQGITTWQELAGYEFVQICMDEHGIAYITSQGGAPLNRGDVFWIVRIAQRYLELYTDDEIEDAWQRHLDIENSYAASRTIKKKQVTSGKVYLMAGGGYHKIGKTINLKERYKQIGLVLPFELTLLHSIQTNDIDALEAYWHNRFGDKHCNREWFSLTPEDVSEFKAHSELAVNMFLHVTDVTYLVDYKLRLEFNNGEVRDVDLKDELYGEIFAPLRDMTLFKKVAVNPDTNTIEWPNGADFAPEFLYEIGQEVRKVA